MENVTIDIPAMYPFPAITLSGHPRHLRLIAHCLDSVEEGDYAALCINLGHKLWKHLSQLENAEQECDDAHGLFSLGMRAALRHPYGGHCTYATDWAWFTHECSVPETYRPAWAWHMARAIYEQMGGD